MRERAAAATRTAILDAAEALFAEHGYPRVTIGRIAQEAGVAQGTVYASFGNKLALIRALTERAAEDNRIGTALAVVAEASDAREIASLVVRGTGDVVRRHGRMMAVLVENASVDAEIGEISAGTERLLRERFHIVSARLATVGALRPGLTTTRAVDVLTYYVGPESWFRLRGLGWSWQACQDWLRRELLFALCGLTDEPYDAGE
ncbi:TetR/AcrR family transcriptional regulator [Actinacidiphila sp. bgisy144]|uniref:TetR/AcrR family transcriptional regulator n=1 Tax=unclassified Actinacidiphila TaxID=2995708 RepID=UPI003EB98C0F